MRPQTVDCPHCGYVHQDPLPTPAELDRMTQALYSSLRPEYREEQDEDLPWHETIQDSILTRLAAAAPEPTLLDIGSGLGLFVRRAKRHGFDALGLDPSRDAVEVARTRDVETIESTIEDLDRGSFGVLTMFNMLEHVLSPRDVLARCRERLVDGGLLYVSVPNDFNPLQRRLEARLGDWWVHPLHVSYFTPRTLRALVDEAGFDVEWASTSFPMEVFALLGLDYTRRPKLGRRLHRLRTWADRVGLHRAYPWLASHGLGRHVNLLLRKRASAPTSAPLGPCPSRRDLVEVPLVAAA